MTHPLVVDVVELGLPYRPDSLYKRHRRAVERSGLPAVDIHALRHTSASAALASGESVVTVSKRIGHARTSITHDIYAHALPEHERRTADTIADAFG